MARCGAWNHSTIGVTHGAKGFEQDLNCVWGWTLAPLQVTSMNLV